MFENILAVIAAAAESQAWPFEQARQIIKRYEGREYPETILLETGYGPSGLPHIGTFGEVIRTSMVCHALRTITENRVGTKILCFSDDMDGMRKVPDNVPNQEMLRGHFGKPLGHVPDPFGTHESFGHNNNARLRAFLDAFGFDYEFASALEYYTSGRFDEGLVRLLEQYDAVMGIMLPTLREERRKTYSPILPLHPETGIVMQVPIEEINVGRATVVWMDPATGQRYETSVLGGGCKAQWKPDWALRWTVLGVDYEMFGKDHIDNVKTSKKICRVLGGKPPEGFSYELFLDEKGEKISKSKGNGIAIDEWLTYAPMESLALYMFQRPKTAKKLYFDVIPKAVDEYYALLRIYHKQDVAARLTNPVWHIHKGNPPAIELPVPFALLLNLVSASNAHDKNVLWGFISRYAPGVTPQTHPELDRLTAYALRYFDNFIKPAKRFRSADSVEREALMAFSGRLSTLPAGVDGETIQNVALDIARGIERYQDHSKQSLRNGPAVSAAFFQMLYQILLGQDRGPRFGSFAALYGVKPLQGLIQKALSGELSGPAS